MEIALVQTIRAPLRGGSCFPCRGWVIRRKRDEQVLCISDSKLIHSKLISAGEINMKSRPGGRWPGRLVEMQHD